MPEQLRGLDTRVELEIKILQALAITIALSAFAFQLWSQNRVNRSNAYQRLVEHAIRIEELHVNNSFLMKAFESQAETEITDQRKDQYPSDIFPSSEYYFVYLGLAVTIWEHIFLYRLKGWIDKKTWDYWDRMLREVHIGQAASPEYPLDKYIKPPVYRPKFQVENPKIYKDTRLLFYEWWHERENWRYCHADFVEYVNEILVEMSKVKLSRRAL